jgi:hypothetical protein
MSAATKMNDGAVTTSDVLKAMLTENTGTHMLDSGFGNGRHWQQNQSRDFDADPSGYLSVHIWKPELHKADWSITLSTYQFLRERVKFSSKWQEQFDAFVEEQNKYTPWMQVMADFMDDLKERGHDVTGPFGNDEPMTVNTYNHESFLSQVLQFTAAYVDDAPLYLLQIHGGADVRGGYTAPKCFTDGGHSECGIFDDTRATVGCDKCEANWTSDGASSFGYDGGSGDPLHEYPVVTAGDELNGKKVRGPAKGRVYLYADKSVSCPKCAKGKLSAYSY